MAAIVLRPWEDARLHQVYDCVLIRSAFEFRHAYGLLRRYGTPRTREYTEYVRRSLRAVEAELARRGIEVDSAETGSAETNGIKSGKGAPLATHSG